MSEVAPNPAQSSALVARVKAILLTPKAEWERIDGEPATIPGLYAGYVAILAAIPALAQLIGGLVFGYGAFFVSWRPSVTGAISTAIVEYVLTLVMVFIMALIIDALAPTFDGQKSQIQAFKVSVYASTASWVAGIFAIFPPLGILSILGLYSLYLYYLGLPKLMKVPESKALAYTAVTIIVAIVLFIVVGAVSSAMTRYTWGGGVAGPMASTGHVSGSINLPGGSVDLGKLDAASKSIAATASQMQAEQSGAAATGASGAVKPVSSDVLKSLLPPTLAGGLARSEVSANSGGVGGIAGSEADGVYTQGTGKRINLQVTDMGAVAALATLGGALNVNSTKETATGYEKVGTVNGRMTTESYDTASKSGKYSVMIASRFMVEADGDGVAMDDLKAAVGSINAGALESLAKG